MSRKRISDKKGELMRRKKLKICYFADPNSIHTQRWLRYFVEQGHEIHLICSNKYDKRIPGVIHHDLIDNLNIKLHNVPKLEGIEWNIRAISLVRNLTRKICPDVVHAHFVTGQGHLAFLNGFHPLVITAWGSDINLYSNQKFYERMLTRLTLKKADLITTPSRDLKNRMINLGTSGDKIHIIQFGVDTKIFHPNYDISDFRQELGIKGKDKAILSPRWTRPHYNIDNVIRAFDLLRNDCKYLKLILINCLSQENYGSYLKDLVRGLQLENETIFIDQVEHKSMARLYNLADVIVSIPNTDGTPVSVLEAMACGCNIVACDVPSLREWIKDGQNGYLVNVNDIEEISHKIKYSLLMGTDERERFISRNLNIIKEKANYYSNMKQMEDLYYSLVEI